MIEQPTRNITSDIPLPTEEPNPYKEEFIKNAKILEQQEAEYEKKIKTIEQELGPIDWQYNPCNDHGEPTKFNASDLRNTILNISEYNIITDKNSQIIYFYTKKTGIYHKNGEQYLRFLIDNVLGEKSATRKINETIELLKIKTYASIEVSPKIAVLNGLLDIKTGKIEDFTSLEFNTNKLNVEFKEDAKSKLWEKFIDQVCPDDKLLLQEWSGYLLVKGYPFHAIMWLYGPTGRNGKGTWARTMQTILGEENYSSVSIDEFDGKHRFAVFNLHDSLFNICSEPRTDRILSIEMLQMLTGQDSIDAERKGVQERFKFKNGAKITVMGNKFPNIDRPTDAFWDRLKLCKFPNRFVGADQKQEIEKTWLYDSEQKSGILNWMIEGAKRLLEKGFTETKTQRETILQFKRASDTIGAFLIECVKFDINAFSVKIETFEHYKKYCDLIGVTNVGNREFSAKLQEQPKIKDTSTRILNKKTKVWGGFKLLPLEKEQEEEKEYPQTKLSSGTNGTDGTDIIPDKNSEIQNSIRNTSQKSVPEVPTVPNMEKIDDYNQLTCVFCGKAIMDYDWTQDGFSWGKPAHKKCYDEKKDQLKQQDSAEGL